MDLTLSVIQIGDLHISLKLGRHKLYLVIFSWGMPGAWADSQQMFALSDTQVSCMLHCKNSCARSSLWRHRERMTFIAWGTRLVFQKGYYLIRYLKGTSERSRENSSRQREWGIRSLRWQKAWTCIQMVQRAETIGRLIRKRLGWCRGERHGQDHLVLTDALLVFWVIIITVMLLTYNGSGHHCLY